MSFKGSEVFTIDSKCRLKFPAKMQKSVPQEANNTFVVTRGLEKSIFIYPSNIWQQKYEVQFLELNQFEHDNRFALREMLEWSEDVSFDTQQRLTLPKELVEYAGIEGKVKLIGMLDHIELWNPEEYERYKMQFTNSYEEVVEKVMTQKTQNKETKI